LVVYSKRIGFIFSIAQTIGKICNHCQVSCTNLRLARFETIAKLAAPIYDWQGLQPLQVSCTNLRLARFATIGKLAAPIYDWQGLQPLPT
jgi:hypothetical protein